MSRLSVVARHGKARLGLVIGENLYLIRPSKSTVGTRAWTLKKSVGEGADAVTYMAWKSPQTGELICTCPDHQYRGVRCKHLGALVACGLLSGRKPRPSEIEQAKRNNLRRLAGHPSPRVELATARLVAEIGGVR